MDDVKVDFAGRDLVDMEGIKNHIKKRLNSGWMVIVGETDAIEAIEDSVYPPNTEKNADLEVILYEQDERPFAIYIAKKNEDLRKYYYTKISDIEWDALLMMICTVKDREEDRIRILTKTAGIKNLVTDDIDKFVDLIIEYKLGVMDI